MNESEACAEYNPLPHKLLRSIYPNITILILRMKTTIPFFLKSRELVLYNYPVVGNRWIGGWMGEFNVTFIPASA